MSLELFILCFDLLVLELQVLDVSLGLLIFRLELLVLELQVGELTLKLSNSLFQIHKLLLLNLLTEALVGSFLVSPVLAELLDLVPAVVDLLGLGGDKCWIGGSSCSGGKIGVRGG